MLQGFVVKSWLFCLVLLSFGCSANALEVVVTSPGASDSFREYISSASLAVQTAKADEVVAQDVLAAARADYQRILGALYERGFYSVEISIRVDGREVADIPTFGGPQTIKRVDIVVDPGRIFLFSKADLAPKAPGTELPEGFAPDRAALSGTILDAAEAGVEGWRDVGHAKARVTDQVVTANHANARLSAEIRLEPGPRLRFGELLVTSRSRVRTERIRDIAGLPEGEVFSPQELRRASQRLRTTGAFRSIVLSEAEKPGPAGTLDIEAELIDAKPRRFGFGAEIASVEGLSLSGFWLHRNLLGGAERLRFDGEVSGIGGESGGIDYEVSARFERPATFTPDTSLFFEATIEEQDQPEFRERSAQIEGGFAHIFSETLEGEIALAYRYSDIDDAAGSRTLEHVLLPVNLTFDTRDEALDAKTGVFADVELTPFAAVGSGGSGLRLYADARTYVGLDADKRYVAAFRAQIGSVIDAGLTEVSPDMLFFSGGADTVRGQPFQSLGVDIGGGQSLGGRSFFAVSAELRASLNDSWSAVGFSDVGFVGANSFGDGDGDTHAGIGFGVRYNTGIGPIRVDIATPLDDDAGQDFEFYVGIGQAF